MQAKNGGFDSASCAPHAKCAFDRLDTGEWIEQSLDLGPREEQCHALNWRR
jgi:hypothetical protein